MSVCQLHGSVSIYVCFCECSVYFNGVLVCDNNSVVCVCVCMCMVHCRCDGKSAWGLEGSLCHGLGPL